MSVHIRCWGKSRSIFKDFICLSVCLYSHNTIHEMKCSLCQFIVRVLTWNIGSILQPKTFHSVCYLTVLGIELYSFGLPRGGVTCLLFHCSNIPTMRWKATVIRCLFQYMSFFWSKQQWFFSIQICRTL